MAGSFYKSNRVVIGVVIGSSSLFVSPHEIISAWLKSRHLADDPFQPHPEAQHLQWIVAPARGDTEIGLVRRHVVDPVMLTRQNHVTLLQPGHQRGEVRVGVRPLVDLVGESD